MQVINNKLQWKVRPLGIPEGSGSENIIELTIPRGFRRFIGEMNEYFINEGLLVDCRVMFKLFDNQWTHFKVVRFIPVADRPTGSLYTYDVEIIAGSHNCGKLPVFFDNLKYKTDACADDGLATWFMLESV